MPKNNVRAKSKSEIGAQIRRAVLGDEYVEKAIANRSDFMLPYEEIANEFVWGTVWARPELPRKTRSLVTIAILTALHLPDELELHLRGALRNGCTEEEIREVLVQTAIYAGVPAAREGFKIARKVLRK